MWSGDEEEGTFVDNHKIQINVSIVIIYVYHCKTVKKKETSLWEWAIYWIKKVSFVLLSWWIDHRAMKLLLIKRSTFL